MSSPLVSIVSLTGATAVAGLSFLAGRVSSRKPATTLPDAGPGSSFGDPGIAKLAEASREQANAMVRVAELSAQSLRAASGTYVFSLRDRFDERLPVTQVGVASTTWQAVGDAPAPLEFLVLHAGDKVRFTLTLVCNQVATDRRVTVDVVALDPLLTQRAPRYQASLARSGDGGQFVCPSDVSLFIELSFDVDVASLTIGERFALPFAVSIRAGDTRPEGAIATTRVDATILGSVVPDDDGVGMDLLAIEAVIGDEERSYFLDKQERLPLSLPGT